MKRTKVICVGEALIDRIKNKTNEDFTDFLGGAPANVACGLKKLRIDSVFIGSIGDDKHGKKFVNYFKKLDVNINYLQLVNNSPTRIVRVDRNDAGDRFFSGFDEIFGKVFADESLDNSFFEKNLQSLEKMFLETKYFVTGTNLLSSSISKQSVYFLLNLAIKFGVKIIIDLNWRQVFWDYSTFSNKINKEDRIKTIKDFLNFANILKLAKEEAILFFENANPLEISSKLKNSPDVIITDGENPISWFINGLSGTSAVVNSDKIVDTTGAGDSFLAGLISKLILFDQSLNEYEIKTCIDFATICGLLTCLGEGAIEQQPDHKIIKEFLGSNIL